MTDRVIHIEEKTVYPSACERFMGAGRIDLSKPKHQRMMETAYQVREKGLAGISIKAAVSFFDRTVFSKGKVCAGGQCIECNFFSQIPEEAVEGVYFYTLTAGECLFESEEKILEFLFADMWGTAYVDAGMAELREKYIESDMKKRFPGKKVWLSEGFGPGYFGMPVDASKKFLKAAPADLINVTVKESGIMLPQKTCTGLYFVLNRDDISAEQPCIRCLGNSAGCDFCAVKRENEKTGD